MISFCDAFNDAAELSSPYVVRALPVINRNRTANKEWEGELMEADKARRGRQMEKDQARFVREEAAKEKESLAFQKRIEAETPAGVDPLLIKRRMFLTLLGKTEALAELDKEIAEAQSQKS